MSGRSHKGYIYAVGGIPRPWAVTLCREQHAQRLSLSPPILEQYQSLVRELIHLACWNRHDVARACSEPNHSICNPRRYT